MKTIKLMADFSCYPLWEVAPSIDGDISPDTLPISNDLREALFAWAAQYDSTLDTDDPPSSGFDSRESADKFVVSGYKLLLRLKEELGSEYNVISTIRANLNPSAR